jgi:Fe-Mn family superoxide dismutase
VTKASDVPGGAPAAAIDRDLGGLAAMQTAFSRAGVGQFGSGWVFVTVTRQGNPGLSAGANPDIPLMDGVSVLMGNDVREHANYRK